MSKVVTNPAKDQGITGAVDGVASLPLGPSALYRLHQPITICRVALLLSCLA